MLVLFDIDGTLLVTKRSGIEAMRRAGADLFGEGFTADGVDFSGRLDPVIIAQLLARNDREATPESMSSMRLGYASHLDRLLRPGVATLLPGVLELVSALALVPELTLGLLTGNYSDTGTLKLERSGLGAGPFTIRAWAEDASPADPRREDLPPVAMQRHAHRTGVPSRAETVLIIGDTPHDVGCARAHGCASLAVATGRFSAGELASHSPTRCVADLSQTEAMVDWIVRTCSSPRRER